MLKRVMIDFETLGMGKNACIVQIGACYFGDGVIGETLKINVDAEDAERGGAVLDANTVYWWLTQSPAAIASITAQPRVAERQAMETLNDFLYEANEIWSHANFDFVILTETLKRLRLKPRFDFRQARDIRTLNALAGTKKPLLMKREGVRHDGLDDAIYQATCVMAQLAVLG